MTFILYLNDAELSVINLLSFELLSVHVQNVEVKVKVKLSLCFN
jgi:hypothetical protein